MKVSFTKAPSLPAMTKKEIENTPGLYRALHHDHDRFVVLPEANGNGVIRYIVSESGSIHTWSVVPDSAPLQRLDKGTITIEA